MEKSNTAEKLRIEKDTVQETLMLPLYGRVTWAERAPKTLPDPDARRICDMVDYDFASLELPGFAPLVWAARQRAMCEAASAYLASHPRATIVDLGCGLATGFAHADNGQCRWVNIDLPDVIAVRDRVLPAREREINLACSAFDTSWFDAVDASEGVYVVSGGMLYYFDEDANRALLTAMAERFGGGGIFFDAENENGVKVSNKSIIQKSGNEGALMKFAVNDPAKTFGPWTPAFKSVRKVGFPKSVLSSSEIPLKMRMMLRMGPVAGTMKFVEIMFA